MQIKRTITTIKTFNNNCISTSYFCNDILLVQSVFYTDDSSLKITIGNHVETCYFTLNDFSNVIKNFCQQNVHKIVIVKILLNLYATIKTFLVQDVCYESKFIEIN